MTTPLTTQPIPASPQASDRAPLRLRMAAHPGRDGLDGGWWPQTRDLTVELADLVDHFPSASGRIMRVLYSPPDWDASVRRIRVARGFVKAGSFPRDDTHVIRLTTSDRHVLCVLVVPPSMSQEYAEEALRTAAAPGSPRDATALLATVAHRAS